MKLLGDFQSVRGGDRLTLSLDYLIGPASMTPSPGSRVVVDDAEGHTATALVLGVRDRLVDAVVDWTSWRDETVETTMPMHVDYLSLARFEKYLPAKSDTYAPARLPFEFVGAA
jgi:hypothetical protein